MLELICTPAMIALTLQSVSQKMNSNDLSANIRYVGKQLESVLKLERVCLEDVAPLYSEIRVLKARFGTSTHISPSVREYIQSLVLTIPESLLPGTAANFRSIWWMYIPLIRNFYLLDRIERDRIKVREILIRFTDTYRELNQLVQLTGQNTIEK